VAPSCFSSLRSRVGAGRPNRRFIGLLTEAWSTIYEDSVVPWTYLYKLSIPCELASAGESFLHKMYSAAENFPLKAGAYQ
jgi:hypothetical protein